MKATDHDQTKTDFRRVVEVCENTRFWKVLGVLGANLFFATYWNSALVNAKKILEKD